MTPQWLKDMQDQLDGAFSSRVVMDKEEAQQLINMCVDGWNKAYGYDDGRALKDFSFTSKYKEFKRESTDHT